MEELSLKKENFMNILKIIKKNLYNYTYIFLYIATERGSKDYFKILSELSLVLSTIFSINTFGKFHAANACNNSM